MSWLADRVRRDAPLLLPGAYDALSARIIACEGAEAIYAGGYAVTASQHALPDMGLLGLAEMAEVYRRIAVASMGKPVIVDADTGHGGLLNVQRTVATFIAGGIAGCHIEDQEMPKRCGHVAGTSVVDRGHAEARIRAADEARAGADFAIIARTDALATHGLDEAVYRARSFFDAGADIVFIDALRTEEQIAAMPRLVGGPILFNAATTAVAPVYSNGELGRLGYSIVIHPIESLRFAADHVRRTARALLSEEGATATHGAGISFSDLNGLLELEQHAAREARLSTVGPAEPAQRTDLPPFRETQPTR